MGLLKKNRNTELSIDGNRWFLSEDKKNCIIMTDDKDIFLDWSNSKLKIVVKKIKDNKPIETLLSEIYSLDE